MEKDTRPIEQRLGAPPRKAKGLGGAMLGAGTLTIVAAARQARRVLHGNIRGFDED